MRDAVRGLRSCLMVAVGVGALTYWLVGDLTAGGVPAPALHATFGPYAVPVAWLRLTGTGAGCLGVGGAVLLGFDVRRHRLERRWPVVAVAIAAAAALTAWSWRCLTAGSLGSDVLARSTGIAAVIAWLSVTIWALGYLRRGRIERPALRGCSYCAQDANLFAGDVQQVSVSEHQELTLLKCPRCDWLYMAAPRTTLDVVPVSEADARERFPSTW